jgi:hypothetical protein
VELVELKDIKTHSISPPILLDAEDYQSKPCEH